MSWERRRNPDGNSVGTEYDKAHEERGELLRRAGELQKGLSRTARIRIGDLEEYQRALQKHRQALENRRRHFQRYQRE
jgi:hypothetical protein